MTNILVHTLIATTMMDNMGTITQVMIISCAQLGTFSGSRGDISPMELKSLIFSHMVMAVMVLATKRVRVNMI